VKTSTTPLSELSRPWAKRLLLIDPRSLASFRVALGLLVLMDLGTRAGALSDHYSDWGVMPRQALAEDPSASLHFCLHALAGSAAFEAVLFAAAAMLGVAFVLGQGGAAVTAALWVLTVSLQNRNFMILNKGDQIFRLMLFWSMFVPLRSRDPVLSTGSAGLLIQAALVWLVSASLKTDRDWFPDGTATYYALQVDQGTTAFGRWIGSHFILTRALTYGVYFVEWAAPLMLFFPLGTGAFRIAAVGALVAMHVGFSLSMRLGFFPAISVCSLIPFVPAAFWDWLGVRTDGRLVDPLRRRESAASHPAPVDAQPLGRSRNAMAAAALFLVLWVNAAAVAHRPLPRAARHLTEVLRLDQNWGMFAPRPWRETNWIVATGRLHDGGIVDVYPPSLHPPARGEPALLSSTFPSPRWLYYVTNVAKADHARQRPWFARYLCRHFDASHLSALPLRAVEIDIFRQWALPAYQRTPPSEEILWRQACDAGGA
jgi:hypothetical protein